MILDRKCKALKNAIEGCTQAHAREGRYGFAVGAIIGKDVVGRFINELDNDGDPDMEHFAHEIIGTMYGLGRKAFEHNPRPGAVKSCVSVSCRNPEAERIAKGIYDVISGDYVASWPE